MGILRSIRFRLTLWYVILLAVILAGFSAGVYLTLRQRLNENLDDSLQNRAGVVAGALHYENGTPTLETEGAGADPDADEHFTRVYDSTGSVTFDDSPETGRPPVDRESVNAALQGETKVHRVKVGGQSMRVRTLPVLRGGEVVGALEVGLSEEDVRETLRILLLIIAVAYPVTLGAASFGGVFLAGRALAPIDKITRTARRISAQELSQRLDLQLADDEIGRLARTFDEMIARLDEAFRRQRQFTADASHELRTPLTSIKGQVEVALNRERSAQAYREVLGTVNEEVDRLIRLVGSLLTLARADAGQIPIARERVELGELVTGAVEQARPMAAERGVRLEAAPAAPVALEADEDLLLQLLLNLVDNAVKHTERGGEVTLGWARRDSFAELWVRDSGAGISPEHLPRIFDRFYRADTARSRAEGGTGLGLSICRWIAEAHGGSISVESVPGEGTAFVVKLPVVAGAAASAS
jgi:heavy metal sensor kinase